MAVDLRIQVGVLKGPAFDISIDGEPAKAYRGETVAAVLIATGRRTFRRTSLAGQPRGLYCGMGICFDCLVTINGRPNQRACLTVLQPGDQIERQL